MDETGYPILATCRRGDFLWLGWEVACILSGLVSCQSATGFADPRGMKHAAVLLYARREQGPSGHWKRKSQIRAFRPGLFLRFLFC
jgi:hypothetical protein